MNDDFQLTERDKKHFSKVKEWERVHEMLNTVKSGCSEEELNKLICPFCSEKIVLEVHPELRTFSIKCSKTSRHFGMTESAEEPPEWWRKKITFGWLD